MLILKAYVYAAVALLAIANSGRLLAADPAPLLDVAKGQIPNDKGNDDPNTKMSIAKSDELGGDALKVEFGAGDSVGVKTAKIKNWKPFSHLSFNVLNPSEDDVLIIFNINHSKTKAFETRVAHEITLKPGKNEIRVPLEELKNTNGSDPDFGAVVRWFVGVEEEKTPTLLFSSILLDDGTGPAATEAPPEKVAGTPKTTPKTTAKPGTAPAAGGAKGSFRIKGTINGQEVDLIITPEGDSAATGTTGEEGTLSVAPEKVVEAVVATTQATTQATKPATTPATGRPKAKLPAIDKIISFDTPEADAIMAAVELFPANSAWHLDVSKFPLHPSSRPMVAGVGAEKPFRCNYDMAYLIVPPTQKTIAVKLTAYAEESDKGPFPVPANLPIEGWPVEFKAKGLSLDAVQRNSAGDEDGDRHAIVLDPGNGKLHEFFKMKKTGTTWEAEGAATFNIRSNKLRPDEWTSADAAGLPILAGVVRHDELKRGVIDHALRVTIRKSRKAYVYPATHQAGHTEDENVMRMGERLRLKASFDVSKFTPEAQTILKALKKHGMFVADNGIEWAISIAPDARIPQLHAELRKVKGSDFEVVEFPKGYKPPAD